MLQKDLRVFVVASNQGSGEVWSGKLVVELGAGVGFLGIYLAKLGAQVVLTDKSVACPLLHSNVQANNVSGDLRATVQEFEWGAKDWTKTARKLGQPPPDCLIAADCIYIDQDGKSPETEAFLEACHLIAGEATICYIAFECRVQSLRKAFLHSAHQHFNEVAIVSQDSVPASFQAEYIEIYKLSGRRLGSLQNE